MVQFPNWCIFFGLLLVPANKRGLYLAKVQQMVSLISFWQFRVFHKTKWVSNEEVISLLGIFSVFLLKLVFWIIISKNIIKRLVIRFKKKFFDHTLNRYNSFRIRKMVQTFVCERHLQEIRINFDMRTNLKTKQYIYPFNTFLMIWEM